jgi:hypothetical protein
MCRAKNNTQEGIQKPKKQKTVHIITKFFIIIAHLPNSIVSSISFDFARFASSLLDGQVTAHPTNLDSTEQ